MTGRPYVEELVARLRLDGGEVEVRYGGRQAADISFADSRVPHRVVLRTAEPQLAAAVELLGAGCRDDLWPDSSVTGAGFNLLLVHVDEVVGSRDTTDPLLITADGLQWPR